jgi:hypothetical protein
MENYNLKINFQLPNVSVGYAAPQPSARKRIFQLSLTQEIDGFWKYQTQLQHPFVPLGSQAIYTMPE